VDIFLSTFADMLFLLFQSNHREVDRVMKLCRFTPSGYEYCFKKTPETRTSTSYALFVIRDMIREATTGDDAVSDDAVPMQEEVCLVAEDDSETDEEIAPLPSRTKKAKAEKKEKEEDSASDDDMQEEVSCVGHSLFGLEQSIN